MKKSTYKKPGLHKKKISIKFLSKRKSQGYTEGPIYLAAFATPV